MHDLSFDTVTSGLRTLMVWVWVWAAEPPRPWPQQCTKKQKTSWCGLLPGQEVRVIVNKADPQSGGMFLTVTWMVLFPNSHA